MERAISFIVLAEIYIHIYIWIIMRYWCVY